MTESDLRSARGYSWPPFEPGNVIALRHGAYSDRAITAKCDELSPGFAEWIEDNAPWASADEFGPVRVNYLRSRAIADLLEVDIAQTVTDKGTAAVPTRRLETFLSALRNEREALAQLGLTPPTKVAMAATVASTRASLADVASNGRRARQARSGAIEAESAANEEPKP